MDIPELKNSAVLRGLFSFAVASIAFGTAVDLRAQCHFPQSEQRAITYRFEPESSPTGVVLHVVVEFQASADGTDTLILPTHWAGETLHSMSDLRSLSKDALLEQGPNADSRIVHAPAHSMVVIEYDLQKDWNGPFVHPLQFHPIITPDYFEFTGTNALVQLRLDDSALETGNFDWQRLPFTWALATSFGTTTAAADRCQTYTGHWQKIAGGLYAAGEFRVRRLEINGQPAFLAVRGTWTFPDDEAVTDIQKVVGKVRDFWHDDNFPYFLVTLNPYDQDHGGSDGSAFTNAFWMFVSRSDSLTGLLPQLAHESFHAWDPERMGVEPTGYNEDLIKWFREGPTDYYAHLLTYRAGTLTAEQYVGWLNALLRRFPTSDDEYVRGPVMSLWLDGTIRKESNDKHSLDDVMFDMVKGSAEPYTLDRILNTADRYLTPASRALLQQAVTAHGELPAPEQIPTLGGCARASLIAEPSFDLGFDFDRSLATKIVTGVVGGGPAFNAGLRDGQSLGRSSFYKHDPDRLATFTIKTNSGDKQITFYPRGKLFQAWHYQLTEDQPCKGVS